jgi:hypothetical protein
VQNIKLAVAPDRFREGSFNISLFANVAMHEVGIAARIFAARTGRLRGGLAGFVNLGNDDLGVLFGKAFGGGTAAAAPRL